MYFTINYLLSFTPFIMQFLKHLLILFFLCFYSYQSHAQREIVLNTTGYGFDRTAANGINDGQWEMIQKFASLEWNGQDAGVTAVRLHIEWNQYEPTDGNYQSEKIVMAIQAILALNPKMKVALHFPYLRPGLWNDNNYLQTSEIAQISDGTLLRQDVAHTTPSIYAESSTKKFNAFVDHVLTSVKDYYPKILYVTMGNTDTEEFYIPNLIRDGIQYPALYEQKAVETWRQKFLPLRFPGQSTITWDNNQYNKNDAPLPADGNWNSELGRDFHRFAGWGLLLQLKGFQDVVKNHSQSLKVLDFISDFGSQQGNLHHLQNSTIPLAFELTDGIYTSDGNDQYDLWRKIAPLDVMKGTDPNKIAAIEFDPTDLGHVNGTEGINENLAIEWMRRAFVHGADFVHIAMHYPDLEARQLAHAIAVCKSEFITNSYQPPQRSAPVTENIYPNVFTDTFLFNQWYQNGGQDWYYTDIIPKSIKMVDNGYWQNIWNTSGLLPCTFTLTASTSNANVAPGTPVTLTASCTGSECDAAGYSWSGPEADHINGRSVTITTPPNNGNYVYSVSSDRSGCSTKTAQISVLVSNVLPVTLIRFTAAKLEEAVALNWSTSSEMNSDFFGIERSNDGKSWKTLNKVNASGETDKVVTSYSYLDTSPVNGENLYRLKMVDRDNTFAYSRIVNINSNSEPFFNIFPNPVSEKLNIHTDDWAQIKKIEILNVSGQIVYDSYLNPEAEINVEDYPAGMYFVRLTHTDGKKETDKFIKGDD